MPTALKTNAFDVETLASIDAAIDKILEVDGDAAHSNDKSVQRDCQLILAGMHSLKATIANVIANKDAYRTQEHRETADRLLVEMEAEIEKVAESDV